MSYAAATKLTVPAITIADVIRDRARIAPHATAILAPTRSPLAFAALVEAIDDSAEQLGVAGLGRGDRVALSLADGPEMAVAVLAVSSCATCVPLNPALDEASYRVALEWLRIDALIVRDRDTPAAHAAEALAIPVLHLQVDESQAAGVFTLSGPSLRPAHLRATPTSDDVALVLHTSGTTQRPKAVPLTQRMLVGPALERARQYRLTPTDRCLCVRPLFTSGGLRRCLFPALVVGGSVICTPGATGHSLIDWLVTFEATFYSAAPAVHRALLDEIADRGSVPALALRFILSASAALPVALAAELERMLRVPVLQGYGMTETGVVAQNPLPPAVSRAGSVGLPAGNEYAIRAEDGSRLPAGETGEIIVRGAEVFAGYERDSAATREAFVDGWFRTGDLGHVDHDGFLFIDGRVNELINRGGFKVSPSAVEAALMRHPDVEDAIAFGIPHATLGEDVVAAVVVRKAALEARDVRDFAFRNLAPFMVPSQVVFVPELPRSSAGKVRRAEVAAALRQQLRPAFTPPRGAREERIARTFADVLGLANIGAFDNFFELGGDSLRGAQVVARINAEARVNLDVATLFRCPTVAEFAAALGTAAPATDSALEIAPIVPASRRDYRPDVPDATPAN